MAVRRSLWAAVAAAVLGLGAVAQAGTVTVPLDPDGPGGNGTFNVGTIDLAPGNALARGAVPTAAFPGFTVFDQFLQAKVSNLLGGNNQVLPVTGLGTSFEITAVAGVTSVGQVIGPSVLFTKAPAGINYLEFWAGPVNANDLAGTGFNDGTLILAATVNSLSGTFAVTGGPSALDQFGTDNYPGALTLEGSGGLQLQAQVTFANPAYFTSPLATLTLVFASSSENLPFRQVDPSAVFVTAPGGVAPSYVPNRGPVNGQVPGTDIQIQADASASFAVPLPSSAAAGLVGLASLIAGSVYRRFRR